MIRFRRTIEKEKAAHKGGSRRERDSNPRYALDVYTLSRRAPSTTRTPLLGDFSAVFKADANICIIADLNNHP